MMRFYSFCFLLILSGHTLYSQIVAPTKQEKIVVKVKTRDTAAMNKAIRALYNPEYLEFKEKIAAIFQNPKAGHFGQFIKGVNEKLNTEKKEIAFTFDACGGKGSGYNSGLIEYLRKEKIPATLFVTGIWIDANMKVFSQLATDSLFEIENHGLYHRLCSVNGATKYGILATNNVSEVIDEMELNARKIEQLTGKRPKYFRSATAFTDETCTKIANELNMQIVSYDLLSGDGIPNTPADSICSNIITKVKRGDIIIMHFNHPRWQEKQAMQKLIPILRKKGYSFVKLENCGLKDMHKSN